MIVARPTRPSTTYPSARPSAVPGVGFAPGSCTLPGIEHPSLGPHPLGTRLARGRAPGRRNGMDQQDTSLVVIFVGEVLAVGAGARRPRQLLGGAYDDQPVAAGQLGHDRVEVAVDLLVAHHGDHLVGQALRGLADL